MRTVSVYGGDVNRLPAESISVEELVCQFKGLGEVERAECLEDCEQIYGRTVADRVRRALEKTIAQEQGRLVGWDGKQFTNLTPEKLAAWKRAYPGVAIDREVAKATAYLQANPGSVKSRFERFMTNWLNKELSRTVRTKRSTGKLSQGQMHLIFVQQHEATRICPSAELAEHLARPNVGARYIVDWLFDDWLGRWGANFSSRWAGMDVAALKTSWAADLGKLKHEEIRVGVVRARRECHSFAPNWQEFVQFCRPTESIETAFMQAASLAARHQVDHTAAWPSAELYWAAQRFGMAALAQSNWGAAKTRFTNLYHDCLAQKEAGDLPPIPAAVPRIEAPERTRLSDAGTTALAQAKALLAKRQANTNRGASM
jgi:hypothetical protein